MTVTEIAILHSTSGGLGDELKKYLLAAQPIQDDWYAKTFPGSACGPPARGAAMYQQIEDPAKILLTARWESVPQHWQWIATDVNKEVLGDIGKHVSMDGDDKIILFHLDADIFGAPAADGETHLLDSPVLSVGRLFIDVDKKAAFQKEFDDVAHILKDFVAPRMVRAGWRADKEAKDKEEFVMVVGWDSVDQHMSFASSPGFAKYAGIRQFVTGQDIKHYKRFM